MKPCSWEAVGWRVVAILDGESTGIPRRDPREADEKPAPPDPYARPVEVGAIIYYPDNNTLGPTWGSLSCPGHPRWWTSEGAAEALQINQLPAADIHRYPLAPEVASGLRRFLDDHRVNVVTSFNVEFDFDPQMFGDPFWLGAQIIRGQLLIGPCLQAEARRAMTDPPVWLSVRRAREFFGLPPVDGAAHQAEADVRHEGELAVAMNYGEILLRRLYGQGGEAALVQAGAKLVGGASCQGGLWRRAPMRRGDPDLPGVSRRLTGLADLPAPAGGDDGPV